MKQMSAREKTLAAMVGAVVFVLVNLLLVSHFVKQRAALRTRYTSENMQWKALQVLFAERDLWAKRDAWVQEKQPKLGNEGSAGVQLLDQIKGVAKQFDIVLENPAIGTPAKGKSYRSVPVNIETKCSWEALIKFLAAIQKPDQFIVFESANIRIEPSDPSLMRGKFRIARWYAP